MRTDLLWSGGSEADAFFLVSPANRYYFTDFASSFGYLVATRTARFLATDNRYSEAAVDLLGEQSYEFVFGSPREVLPVIVSKLKALGVKTVALEDKYLTKYEYDTLSKDLADFTILPAGDAVSRMRLIKTPDEIDRIKKAEDITSEAFNRVLEKIKPNVTEIDIAAELEYQIKKLGGEGTSFDTIVAAGVNTSKPHAVPTAKKVQAGEMVLMDFGAKYMGYCADMTRTVQVGKNGGEMKSVYDIVLKAQQYALSNIKAGMSCREADSYAREYIVANGYPTEFCHSLGHGVGLDIHEGPTVSAVSGDVLEENMVISVEPGVYLAGKGGVRIEDLAVVKKDGLINLTTANKELIIL